jgi:hypothetical protein
MPSATQHARVADRPCRGVFNVSDFDERFPDLSMSLSQGRRLTRKPFGVHGKVIDLPFLD